MADRDDLIGKISDIRMLAINELEEAAKDITLEQAMNALDADVMDQMRPAALYFFHWFKETLNDDDVMNLAVCSHATEMTYWCIRLAELDALVFPNRPTEWYSLTN